VSALEIEDAVRTHPAVADCAVTGLPDEEWGQRVCAFVEVRQDTAITIEDLRECLKTLLAPYKIPRELRVVAALPRNAMGKVNKPALTAASTDASSGTTARASDGRGQRSS